MAVGVWGFVIPILSAPFTSFSLKGLMIASPCCGGSQLFTRQWLTCKRRELAKDQYAES